MMRYAIYNCGDVKKLSNEMYYDMMSTPAKTAGVVAFTNEEGAKLVKPLIRQAKPTTIRCVGEWAVDRLRFQGKAQLFKLI